MLLFDVTQPYTFENVSSKWFPELTHYCPGVPILLVGNKSDLRDDSEAIAKREDEGIECVSLEEAEDMARECPDCVGNGEFASIVSSQFPDIWILRWDRIQIRSKHEFLFLRCVIAKIFITGTFDANPWLKS